jgi:hypothetical protein
VVLTRTYRWSSAVEAPVIRSAPTAVAAVKAPDVTSANEAEEFLGACCNVTVEEVPVNENVCRCAAHPVRVLVRVTVPPVAPPPERSTGTLKCVESVTVTVSSSFSAALFVPAMITESPEVNPCGVAVRTTVGLAAVELVMVIAVASGGMPMSVPVPVAVAVVS